MPREALTEYLPIKVTADLKQGLEEMADRKGYGGASTLARLFIEQGLRAMQAEEQTKREAATPAVA